METDATLYARNLRMLFSYGFIMSNVGGEGREFTSVPLHHLVRSHFLMIHRIHKAISPNNNPQAVTITVRYAGPGAFGMIA